MSYKGGALLRVAGFCILPQEYVSKRATHGGAFYRVVEKMFEIISICKGGGYRYCRTFPAHPKRNAKGLYPLHRVFMENKIGRLLAHNEEIHHIDQNKENDSIENLQLTTKSEHTQIHNKRVSSIEVVCACGKEFREKPSIFRRREKRNKTGVYCSLSCAGKFALAVAKISL